jgi:RNA polymerase sigma factor (sigma-70 family)
MADLARCLRRLVTANNAQSDAELLERFVANRDGLAFAALVSRHGPMVLAVCQRVLRHRQDAEDAFQATFLVLAQQAGTVKRRGVLGSWLHGVAYRTALSARRRGRARRTREARAASLRVEEPEPDGLAPELLTALDRELAALPEVYRAAVVACDLEGLSRAEAATRLGWSAGTLSSRLARARVLLAQHLSRYGLAVPVAGLGAVAGPVAVAGTLMEPTVRLGTLVAAGKGAIAAPVAALMEEAMGTLVLTKFKALAMVLVVGCAVAVTGVAGWRGNTVGAADPPKADTPKRTAPNPDKERIAELERERELLLKQLAELQVKLLRFEAEAQLLKENERAQRAAELLAKEAAEREAATRMFPKRVSFPAPKGILPPTGLGPPAVTGPNVPAPSGTLKPTIGGADLPLFPGGPTLAGPGPQPEAASEAVVRVYSVGDLARDEKQGEALAKVIRATVEPKSWGADVGVEFLPGRNVLVVRQTARIHKQIDELLRQLQPQGSREVPSQPGK